MWDLTILRGDTQDASWKEEWDVGILITSGSRISYFYGDGMQESQGKKDFALSKNLLALIEKNGSLVCML